MQGVMPDDALLPLVQEKRQTFRHFVPSFGGKRQWDAIIRGPTSIGSWRDSRPRSHRYRISIGSEKREVRGGWKGLLRAAEAIVVRGPIPRVAKLRDEDPACRRERKRKRAKSRVRKKREFRIADWRLRSTVASRVGRVPLQQLPLGGVPPREHPLGRVPSQHSTAQSPLSSLPDSFAPVEAEFEKTETFHSKQQTEHLVHGRRAVRRASRTAAEFREIHPRFSPVGGCIPQPRLW